MFQLKIHKTTHLIMLFAVLFMLSNTLFAQNKETNSLPPLSIKASERQSDTIIYTSTEFSATHIIDSLVQQNDSTMAVLPNIPNSTPNADTSIAQSITSSANAEEDTTAAKELQASVNDSVVTKPIAALATQNTDILQDSTCIDLAFDNVTVTQMTEKYVEIEYSIVNKGTAPAPIFGSKRSVTDNVAIHFYYSGTPRLNRGSILAEGIYLTEGLRETKGMLAPNAVYKNKFKLSLEKKNRLYGVIILQLDAFDVIRHECDETNNVFSIVPKWY